MRVELRDNSGYSHIIDSQNTELIGMWFADWFSKIGSDISYPRWMITVMPSNPTEQAFLKDLNQMPYQDFVNSKRMFGLAKIFTEAADKMERAEHRPKV